MDDIWLTGGADSVALRGFDSQFHAPAIFLTRCCGAPYQFPVVYAGRSYNYYPAF